MIPAWVAALAAVLAYVLGMASFVIFDAAAEQRANDQANKP